MSALEGSISEFGLADILQLIYYQRKTGLLTVKGKYDTVKITFLEGKIIDVTSQRRPDDKRLGQIMLKRGKISPQTLQELLQKQKSTGKRIGELLLEEGIVSREEIQEAISHQIIDQMVVMFSWKEGYYSFKPQRVSPREDELQVPVDTQQVLMEGLRIVDEWSVVEGIITPSTVFRKKTGVEPELGEIEQSIWEQIDGESDVSTIIDVIGGEDLAISKALLEMLEKGYIEPVEEAEKVKTETRKPLFAGFESERLVGLVLAFIILLALVMGVFNIRKGLSDLSRTLKAKEQIDRASHMVELYFRQEGLLPEALSPRWTDPWGHPLVYRVTEKGYEIFSAGPDGQVSTEDDIF